MASGSHAPTVPLERSDAAPEHAWGSVEPGSWQRRYSAALVGADAVAIFLVSLLAGGLRSNEVDIRLSSLLLALAFTTGWLASLAMEGAYDVRFLGTGAQEYQKVAQASFKYAAVLAILVIAVEWRPDRTLAGFLMVSGLVLLLCGRKVARRTLHRQRAKNCCVFRVLAVGDRGHVAHLISSLRRNPAAGFTVVGACVSDGDQGPIGDVRVVGDFDEAREAAERFGADVIAVTSSARFHHDDVKALGWSLEGSGIHLVLAPSLADVAGPRISVRPVSGLPLIYVDEPDLGLGRSLVKGVIDRVVAAAVLAVAWPVMLVIAVLIKLDSAGPVLFKQARVGKDGQVFRVWKFRSMTADAEALVQEMARHNESDGLLFKVKADPRVTRVGERLRRWSLDELPQLVNVLKGEMSLIGPRPLPVSPESFRGSERRRLLVKPGVTGLWQVSGRSETKWEEAVRLDLYYVENWSLWLDLVILWKTIRTVTSNRGAY